jgi:hypothetical protein
MNDFLIDCSLQSYSMGRKFHQFIQRYAIFSRAMLHSSELWSRAMQHSAGKKMSSVLCGNSAVPWSCAMDCSIARDNTYLFISWQIRNDIRKYFRACIVDLP